MVDDELLDFVPIQDKSGIGSIRLRLMAHSMAWGVPLVLLACGVPRVEMILADFGLPVPDVTNLVIEASHMIVAVVALTVILLVADGLVMTRFARRGDFESVRAWSSLMFTAPVVVVGLTLWALYLAMPVCFMRLSG